MTEQHAGHSGPGVQPLGTVKMLVEGSPTTTTLYSPASSSSWAEKKTEKIEARPVDSDYPVHESPTSNGPPFDRIKHIAWRPSLLRIGPLFGIGALVLAFLQILAAYAVLKASDGDTVSRWKYQPTVSKTSITSIIEGIATGIAGMTAADAAFELVVCADAVAPGH